MTERPNVKHRSLSLFDSLGPISSMSKAEGPPPAFDKAKAEKRRDRAIAAASANAPEWVAAALSAIRVLALSRIPFVSEDVLRMVGKAPPDADPRALGGAFVQAKSRGWIKPTGGFKTGTSVTRHSAPIRVWVGTGKA